MDALTANPDTTKQSQRRERFGVLRNLIAAVTVFTVLASACGSDLEVTRAPATATEEATAVDQSEAVAPTPENGDSDRTGDDTVVAVVDGATGNAGRSKELAVQGPEVIDVAADVPASQTPGETVPEELVSEPDEIDLTVAAAKASPLFVRELRSADLADAGFANVEIEEGVEVDTEAFLAATALPTQVELNPLFVVGSNAYLGSAPVYNETILALTDRLVIDRELSFELAPGACDDPTNQVALTGLCFSIDKGAAIPADVAASLDDARSRLTGLSNSSIAAGSVTVAEALSMTDLELLDLMLNQGEHTIRRLSIVPLASSTPGGPTGATHDFLNELPVAHLLEDDVVGPPRRPTLPTRQPLWTGPPESFDTEYFLTGWTLGKQIEDTWEYTFLEATTWTDRYYVKFDYELSFGLGVRAPFSVDVSYQSGNVDSATVAVEVAPVDVDDSGSPAYPAVGLSQDKFFDGNEFVLELQVGCTLKISMPGPDPSTKSCDSLSLPGIDKSRDIDPVIGDEESNIQDWWLEGSKTGLAVDVGVGSVSLDLGIGADVTNGKIGMRFDPLPNTTLGGADDRVMWFGDRDPAFLTVNKSGGTEDAGFTVSDPRYAFDLTVRPKARIKAEVDIEVYENEWDWTWPLDFLAISKGFELDHHDGTVASHDFALEWRGPLATDGRGGGLIAG